MTTLALTPTYPAAGRICSVVIGLEESGADFARLWCTLAPEASPEGKKLRETGQDRIELYADSGGDGHPFQFKPQVGGKYTFVVQEYRKRTGAGPTFEGDPRGATAQITKLGSEATLTFFAGQRMTMPIGAQPDDATLAFWVWDATIRATTLAEHGEQSPRVYHQAIATSRARAAIESATVTAALAALADVAATTAAGALAALISNFQTRWNAHAANATVHDAADTANPMPAGFETASDMEGLVQYVSRALEKLGRHFTNDSGTGADSADYHNVSGKKHDWDNQPLIKSAASVEEAYAGFAELHRCYELHRVDTAIHNSADTTALTALPALMAVHEAFLQVLADSEATPPPAQSSGVMTLMQLTGAKEAPLP